MAAAVRKALHAYLSDDAYETWHRFAKECGCSLGAVLTAFGPALRESTDMTTGQKLEEVVNQARDAEREKRRARREAIAQRTAENARRSVGNTQVTGC